MSAAAPRHRDLSALLPIVSGLYWLLGSNGGWWFICSVLPGVLLLATGTAMLLWPGEGKISQYMAFGSVLGVLLSVPAMALAGFGTSVLLAFLSIATFLLAGRAALLAAPEAAGAPAPALDLGTSAKAALDEALLGYFISVATVPEGAAAVRMCEEAGALEAVLRDRGWLDDVASFHRQPGAPDDARLETARSAGHEFQRLYFSSGFEPDAKLPGADIWSSHVANRESVANVFRQTESGRPWLLCIHGYRMGTPFLDLRLFPPRILRDRYNLNLLMPTLPLHGPRRWGRRSGDHFLDGDLLDLLHAETQALWDLRRSIAWIRTQEPGARIGVLGYSLGGYNAALLAAHEPGLDFVVAGIPVCDFANALWQHIPQPQRDYFAVQGLDQARYRKLLRVVSPLAVMPELSKDRLHIFAGSADRVVPPEQPLRLAKHWGTTIHWYPGAHLTFRGERAVVRCIEDAMTGAGWVLRNQGTA